MPIYCYRTTDGEVSEKQFPLGGAPEKVRVGRKVARRDYQAENTKVPVTRGWPMEPCIGSGVNAAQAQELRDFFQKHNCPTEVVDGDPVYRDKNHRDRALKLRGYHDRN